THGYVFEVDPQQPENDLSKTPIKEMGRFSHEACAIDPSTGYVYLTEDSSPSYLCRFIPNDLSQKPGSLQKGGKLYAAAVTGFTSLINNASANSKLVPNALHKRGQAYANQGRHNEAIQDYKRVLDEFPTSKIASGALYSLQESLAAQNRSEEFDAYLAKYKANNPESTALESIEFEAAKTLYFNEKYDQAATKLEAYLTAYPKSPFVFDARYFLADSYLRQKDTQRGLQRMKEVVAENKSEYVNRAIQRVADLEFEAANYTEAIKYYSRLRDVAANRKEQQNALTGLMMSYYNTSDYAGSKRIAAELISQGNAALNAYNTAMLYRGKSTYQQGDLAQALKELREASAAASDVHGAEAQYLVAEILYKQKKYKESLDEAFAFNNKFSNHDLWLGRTFLLIADNYTAQNELFQAKATLNSIIEGSPVPEVVEEAKQKLEKLNGGSGNNSGKQQPK
ncbi:MAG TPA: alkaline phosphatase PhoX, partial [Pontibacter sp.]